MLEDKLLIFRFKRGDCDALRQIYDKYKGDLLKLAIFLTGDINRSEDIVQDVFVKLGQDRYSQQSQELSDHMCHEQDSHPQTRSPTPRREITGEETTELMTRITEEPGFQTGALVEAHQRNDNQWPNSRFCHYYG